MQPEGEDREGGRPLPQQEASPWAVRVSPSRGQHKTRQEGPRGFDRKRDRTGREARSQGRVLCHPRQSRGRRAQARGVTPQGGAPARVQPQPRVWLAGGFCGPCWGWQT